MEKENNNLDINQEEILTLLRQFREKMELQFSENEEEINIEDIKYCGKKVFKEEIEGEIKEIERDIFLLIKNNDGKLEYEYYTDEMMLAKDTKIGVIPTKAYLDKYKDASIIEDIYNNEEQISLNELEEERLEKLAEVTGQSKEQIRACSEIETNQKVEKKSKGKENNNEQEDKKNLEKISTKTEIDPNNKVTQTETFADIVPGAKKYSKIAVVCSEKTKNRDGRFTFVGITKEGQMEPLEDLLPTNAVNTGKSVVSMNRDGSVVQKEQVSSIVKVRARENEGFSLRIGQYGQIEAGYLRKSTENEYINAPVETTNLKPTNREVRTLMDKTKNTYVNDEIDRAENQFKEHEENEKTNINNIDENETNNIKCEDNVIVLSDGRETTFEEEARKAKVSVEEFRNKFEKEAGDLSPEQKLENVHQEIEEEYIGPAERRKN